MQSDRPARTGADGGAGDPLIGRVLDGRYEITARVARGGMASVYEATDIRLDRTVAVKVMHPGLGDDDEFAARFVREARSAARLSHPNVVNVFDQGDDHGTVFLAMELVPGHTLRDVIRKESPMTPARALALIEPVLSALAAAHRAGLIHRDIKPENVLIADDGRVKVADFGLAKAVSADTQHTATGGVLIGTVSYLAPELVVDGRADARADVYAAGVVLFELLTGVKPHEGESPIQVAYKHVHADVPPPSDYAEGIPGYVDALVARATARDRDQRAADAAVLLHQVHRVSTALAQGVREDADLEADLRPRPAPADTAGHASVDTEADPFDADEFATLLSPAQAAHHVGHHVGHHEPTTTIHRADVEHTRVPERPAPPRGVAAGPPAPGRPRRSRRGPILLVLALLVAAAAGVGAYWFGWARYTSTPAVLGLGRTAAVEKLDAAGLDTELGDREYSETVPAGKVLATDPAPGEKVLDHGTVTLVLSLGKERYDVPQLRGMTEDDATDALADTHLAVGETTLRWSETVPEGQVIATDPKPGTTLRPDAIVDLVVSKGRRPIEVGDWVGKDADRAEQALQKKGLVVDRSQTEYSDTVDAGDVIAQTPESGTLYKGETVTLVVSDGPELIEVPGGLVASGVEAAREKLEALGFDVDIEHSRSYLGLGYVFSTDPDSGSMVPQGSTITLYII